MEIDKVIKKSLESKAEAANLSSEKSASILDFIEKEGNKEREKLRNRIINGILQVTRKTYFSEFAEITVFVLILVLVPFSIKYFGKTFYSKGQTNTPVQVNENIDRINDTNEIKDLIAAEQIKTIELRTSKSISTNNRVKTETIEGEDKIKERCPFAIENPKYLPQGFKLKSISMDIINDDFGNMYRIFSMYRDSKDKELNILQGTDAGKPGNLLSECEKISINGKDAWVKDNKAPKNNLLQIMLWKNGEYYNITSSDIGREELIKIAESLDFTIASDTREGYRRGFEEFYYDIDEITAKVPFEINYPKYLPEDYSDLKASLTVKTIDKKEIHMLFLSILNTKEGIISILEMKDAGKLEDIITKSSKIDLNGTDGWVYEPKDDKDTLIQVILWKNGKFYDICGDRMMKEELIKVAKSL